MARTRIKLIAESILIPGLVEENEIERIAEFIASVNPAIPNRIDAFIPLNDTFWKRPSPEEVAEQRKWPRSIWIVYYANFAIDDKREAVNIYP